MPIKQERLINLIETTESFYQKLKNIKNISEIMSENESESDERLNAILNTIDENMPSIEDVETLVKEREHFKHSSRKNTRAAQKMKLKRQLRKEEKQEIESETFMSDEEEKEKFLKQWQENANLVKLPEGRSCEGSGSSSK